MQLFSQTPRIKRALSSVIAYELRRPGEFTKWLEDLHIEHWRAGFADRQHLEAGFSEKKNAERLEQDRTRKESETANPSAG
jgi:hypothetical protein